MGLRINSNLPAVRALRNLGLNDRNQSRSLERLSTGLRINRAGDDPSGLVISEQLRSQMAQLEQAQRNTQDNISMIATTDAALQEVSDRLVDIQDSILFALNTGSASADQIAAEQDAVDNAIEAISRVAATTRFADASLLNGTKGFTLSAISITGGASAASGLNDLEIRRALFSPGQSSRTFTMSQIAQASRGELTFSTVAAGSGVTIRVSGARGSADITLAGGATVAQVASAVDSVSGITGVFTSTIGAVNYLLSEEFGSDNSVSVEVLAAYGASTIRLEAGARIAGYQATDTGGDAQIRMNGNTFTAVRNGREFAMNVADIQMSFKLNPADLAAATLQFGGAAGTTGVYSVNVKNSGVLFQLGTEALATDQIQLGIRDVSSSVLGLDTYYDPVARVTGTAGADQGGALTSLRSGGVNDLSSDSVGNAKKIVDNAISQVSSLRGFLGALQQQTLEPNLRSVEVQNENIAASESQIRDLNFAEETTNFTKTQILFQAGIATLASANLIPQTVLTLLR